jgi:hypothetical protein
MPWAWFALASMLLMWLFQLKLLLMVIPKYFVSVTIYSCWSCITYGCFFVVLTTISNIRSSQELLSVEPTIGRHRESIYMWCFQSLYSSLNWRPTCFYPSTCIYSPKLWHFVICKYLYYSAHAQTQKYWVLWMSLYTITKKKKKCICLYIIL